MNRKAVFFDADGTLCDMEKGVPQSTKEALKKLRENGHDAWLCTGRSRAFVSRYLEELPFTGMISACGATIEKDGERLFNKEMPPEVAKKSVEILRRYGLVPVMEGADFMYYDKDEYNTDVNWYTDLITESLGSKWRPIRGNEDCMRINKISAKMIKDCDAEAACRELSEYYDIIRHESGSGIAGTTIELVPKGFNKAVGISAVCRLFDIPWEDTIVFGDSNNDLAMFDQKSDTNTACNSDICFFCFSRSVYHTSHNRYFNIKRDILHHSFYLVCKTDQINLCTSAGWT